MSDFKAHWPNYAFASYEGGEERVFAWVPRRCWNGSWAWMRYVYRRANVVHSYFDDGGDVFFVYSKPINHTP
jgi:hypothetical protein